MLQNLFKSRRPLSPQSVPESTPYVDPEPAPAQESLPVQDQPQFDAVVESYTEPQRQQDEYTQRDLDGEVLQYMSKKLGRQVNSFEDFNQPQVNESVDAINRFVQETGRSPQDWFRYQTLNPEAMDDLTAVKVAAAAGYKNLSPQEIDMLVKDNYKIDAEKHGEETARLAALRLKIDAEQAREEIQRLEINTLRPFKMNLQRNPCSISSGSITWHKSLKQSKGWSLTWETVAT